MTYLEHFFQHRFASWRLRHKKHFDALTSVILIETWYILTSSRKGGNIMVYLLRRPFIKVRNFHKVCLCQIFRNLNISFCFCQVTEKHLFSYYLTISLLALSNWPMVKNIGNFGQRQNNCFSAWRVFNTVIFKENTISYIPVKM